MTLPSLGPRGEGWVVAQAALLTVVAVSGLAKPSWGGTIRSITTVAGAAAIAAGGVLAILGGTSLGRHLTPLPRPRDDARLVDTGIYASVRHPIYGGIVTMAAGWALLSASLVTVALAPVTAGFFWLKTEREEAWLTDRFPTYSRYRQGKRRLIPGLW
jgi:protein-S-isoprenylcysteine O-methyltransferase Ste14